ncbi:MAG: tetratricopeptide repeat protein [Planctomycetia bacterium]
MSGTVRYLLLICCLLTLVPAVSAGDDPNDDFNLGVNLYRTRRYDASAETFSKFLTDYPKDSRCNLAKLYLALSQNSLEQYESARKHFDEFLKADPDGRYSAEARYRLGECSYYLRDYLAATDQLSDFLKRYPQHSLSDWASLLLGNSWLALNQFEKAQAVLTPLVPGKPGSPVAPEAGLSLGRVLEGLNQPEAALEQYRRVGTIENSPLRSRAFGRIGALEYVRRNFQQSADAWESALADSPQSAENSGALLGSGMALFQLKDFDKALQRLQGVPDNTPSTPQARYLTAMVFTEQKKLPEARTAFDQALIAAGKTTLATEISFQRAQLEQSAGEKKTAIQLYVDIADRWPADSRVPACLFNAAELSLESGETEAAQRLWTRLTADSPKASGETRARILLGRIQLAKPDVANAIQILDAVTKLSEQENPALISLARYYLVRACYEGQQYGNVVQQCQLLLQNTPPDRLGDFTAAFALGAVASLELPDYSSGIGFANVFLQASTDKKQRAEVNATRAIALTGLKMYPDALAALTDLSTNLPEMPQVWKAVLTSAEMALKTEEPGQAEPFFALAAARTADPAICEAGRAGVAWSQFKSEKFADAEQAFALLTKEYPSSEDHAQNVFMMARCVEEQADPDRTSATWLAAWEQLSRDLPVPARGEEKRPPLVYVFDSGQQAARSLEAVRKFEQSASVRDALLARFPNAEEADRVLDEWAWMHASAEQYDQSDALYKRLLEKFPDSPFAGQARLSLAESTLQAGTLSTALTEMQAIVADNRYGLQEKERALFHVVEIQAALDNWTSMKEAAEQFLNGWPESPLAPQIRLFLGDAQLQSKDPAAARKTLLQLKEDVLSGKVPDEKWTDRLWVVLAETSLAETDYEQIDVLQKELQTRNPNSAFLFQLMDVQGRRWKQQPSPDFEKSRDYLRRVTTDTNAKGTITAARCQALIADTYVLQNQLEEAIKEYFRVYLNHQHDELRAQALFQAASCEVRLKKTESAIRDFRELLTAFPNSPLASQATDELKKLNVDVPEKD